MRRFENRGKCLDGNPIKRRFQKFEDTYSEKERRKELSIYIAIIEKRKTETDATPAGAAENGNARAQHVEITNRKVFRVVARDFTHLRPLVLVHSLKTLRRIT